MKTLGKFEILEKVGQGAMGVVYKARDPSIGRLVALKTITTGLADDPDLLQRFYQEARSAGALEHPNIVTIYELGKEGDTPFIAMQFLEGESLDKLLERQASLPLSLKIGFVVYVCRALEYAHKRGVIHRDVKPGNVMVTTDGAVKVVDFGIARLGDTGKSQTGMMVGTLGYMSPQQFRNIPADARSDIWAAGVMFYEILAGRRPFGGDDPGTLITNIMMQEPPSLTEAVPGTAPDLAAVIERMLKKEIEQRFQSMEEVLIELEPVWGHLQKVEVSDLVRSAEALRKAGDLSGAQDAAIRACKIDTTYTQARLLLEQINSEIRRHQIIPEMKARVEKGQSLLGAKQFEEAKAEAKAALRLDSTFQPAKDLLAQVHAAVERERELALVLRTSKQRLAEGALTEAELELAKVLQIDAANAVAQDMLQQIRHEKVRRERQKRVAETLHRARALWTDLHYEACVQLLVDAQQEFPGEPEIAKILETAQQDQAEHAKQALLNQARNFLRAQQFDEALEKLDRVLGQFPTDPTANNLRTQALQGREQQVRERRLKEDLANLRILVKDAKHQQAIQRGEQLLQEFPKDFDLAELVAYAKSEQAQLEQKHRRARWLEKANAAMKDGWFPEAIQAVETALGEFPRDMDLLNLLENAKRHQADKEKRELLEQRIRDIKSRINREEFSDAIDLARQTLVTLGPDTGISQLLNQAEVEYDQREKKKQDQRVTVEAARTLIDAGMFDDATLTLRHAIETRLFSDSDPRLAQLQRDLEPKKTPPPSSEPSLAPGRPATVPGPGTVPSPQPAGGDLGKEEHVIHRGGPVRAVPVVSRENANASSIFSATSVTGPLVQPAPPPPPRPAEKGPASPGMPRRTTKQTFQPAQGGATSFGYQAQYQESIPGSSVERARETDTSVIEFPPAPPHTGLPVEPLPEPTPRPSRKKQIAIGLAGAAVLALLINGILYLKSKPHSVEQADIQPQPVPIAPSPAPQPISPTPTQAPHPTPVSPAPAPRPASVAPTPLPQPARVTPPPGPQPAPDAPTPPPQPPLVAPDLGAQPASGTPAPPQPAPDATTPPRLPTPAAPAPPPVAPVSTDQTRIRQLLNAYAQAYASRDRVELRTVWPTMTDKQFNEYQGNFKSAESIRLSLNPCGSPEIDGNSASIVCTQYAVITVRGAPQQTLVNAATFYLRKSENAAAGWIIDRINYRKASR